MVLFPEAGGPNIMILGTETSLFVKINNLYSLHWCMMALIV